MVAWTTMRDLDAGDLVLASDMDALRTNLEYLEDCNWVSSGYVAGSNYSTSSSSWANIDGTNLAITIVTAGRPILLYGAGKFGVSGSPGNVFVDIMIDADRVGTSRLGGSDGLVQWSNSDQYIGFAHIQEGLSAGTHTAGLQWKNTGTNGALLYATNAAVLFGAIELQGGL